MSIHDFREGDLQAKKFPASSFTSSIKQKPRSSFGASLLKLFSCCVSQDDHDGDANEKARPVLTIGSPTNFRHEKVCIPGLEGYSSRVSGGAAGGLKLSSPERNWTTLHNLAAEKEVSLSPSSASTSSLPSPMTPKEEQQPQLNYHMESPSRDQPSKPLPQQPQSVYDNFWSTTNMVNSRPETIASSPAKSEHLSPAKSLAASSVYSPYASPERGMLDLSSSPTGLRQHPVGMIDYQLRELPATPDQRR